MVRALSFIFREEYIVFNERKGDCIYVKAYLNLFAYWMLMRYIGIYNEISFKAKLKLHLFAILLWPAPIYEIIHKIIHTDKEELNDAFDEVFKGEESKK